MANINTSLKKDLLEILAKYGVEEEEAKALAAVLAGGAEPTAKRTPDEEFWPDDEELWPEEFLRDKSPHRPDVSPAPVLDAVTREESQDGNPRKWGWLLNVDNSSLEMFSSVVEKVCPESPSSDAPRPAPKLDAVLLDAALLDAVLESSAMKEEGAFLQSLPAETIFSYRVDARDKLYNSVIADALRTLLSSRQATAICGGYNFMSCREFIASSEQYKRWEERSWQYDYDSLGSGLSDNILCLEDLDLLPLLPNKDFCEFLDFLKIHGNGSRFFLFGDFKSLTATLSIRVKELEMALNVRDFNAEQIFVDEPCILRGMFRMADMRISASAEKILDDAWNYFRQQHREKRVNEVLRTFIEKTRFALLKSGRRDVHAETFDWLGMPKATTPKMRGTSRRFKPQTLRELDNLAGMDKIKAAIERLTAHAFVSKKKAAAGLAVKPHNFSFLFLGNPGTGKTTVARILAETLRELGVLKKGHLVAAHRGNLIAPYLGQTAMLVTETFISALDGVLFVDEAYSLCAESSQDEYGKEAVNTLNLLMSEYAGRIAVIFAGYPKEMEAFLAASNPGLRERFAYKFIFEDYTEEELVEIFSNKLRAAKLALADGGEELVRRKIAKVYKDKDEQFANARVVDNLFQELLQAQEERLASRFYRGLKTGARALTRLTVEDCQKLLESEVGQRFKKERRAVGF